jgi:hypothetical protein
MCALVTFLHEWQELVAAIVTSILGVTAALVVSRSDSYREERSAAYLLLLDLNDFLAAALALEERWEHEKNNDQNKEMWYSKRLSELIPEISPLFDANMVRIAPVDDYLSGHLGLFLKLYRTTPSLIANIQLAENGPSHATGYISALQNVERNRDLLITAFLTGAAHAACARNLIDKLVLGRRWWKRFLPKTYNQTCSQLLTKGELDNLDEPLEKFTNG